MEDLKFKTYSQFKQFKEDVDKGILYIEGYASKFLDNGKPVIDYDGEIVDVSGFDLSTCTTLLFNHDHDEYAVGKCRLEHRPDGAYLYGEIHREMNDKVYYAVKHGIMTDFSIGFIAKDYEFKKIDGEDVLTFTSGFVFETSIVNVIGANPLAKIDSTKSLKKDKKLREIATWLQSSSNFRLNEPTNIKSIKTEKGCVGFSCSIEQLKKANPESDCSCKAMNPDSSIVDFINGTTEETRVTEITTEEANNAALAYVKEYWNLCPEKASTDPEANPEVWQHMASVWNVTEAEARRRLCANCEYYDNTPEAMKEMDAIPQNEYDKDGGGRGYCHKFDFICHNLRTCQAWEEKEYYNPDEEEKSLKKDIKNIIKGLTFEDTQKERWTQARLLEYFIGVLTTTIEDNFYGSMWKDDMSPEDYKQNILDALSAFGEKLNELPVLDIQVPDTVQKEIKREFMTKEMENNTPDAQIEGTPPAEGTEILEGENIDTPEPVVEPTAEQDAQNITTNSEVVEPVSEDVDAPIEQSVSKPTVQAIIGTLATVNLNDLTVEEIEAMYNTSSDLLEKIEAYVKADIEGEE